MYGQARDIINIPIIPNARAWQYNARAVTALPTSSDENLATVTRPSLPRAGDAIHPVLGKGAV